MFIISVDVCTGEDLFEVSFLSFGTRCRCTRAYQRLSRRRPWRDGTTTILGITATNLSTIPLDSERLRHARDKGIGLDVLDLDRQPVVPDRGLNIEDMQHTCNVDE